MPIEITDKVKTIFAFMDSEAFERNQERTDAHIKETFNLEGKSTQTSNIIYILIRDGIREKLKKLHKKDCL